MRSLYRNPYDDTVRRKCPMRVTVADSLARRAAAARNPVSCRNRVSGRRARADSLAFLRPENYNRDKNNSTEGSSMRGSAVLCRAGLVAIFALGATAPAGAQQPTREGIEFFETKIRPVLIDNCHKCHTGADPKGKLRLDSRSAMLKGGETGPAVVPGAPDKSLLVKGIRHLDPDF